MSRIRTIKPEWRTDQKLGRAGLPARVLSVALITLADDEGRGQFRAPVLAVDVFGYEEDPSRTFREALAKLSPWFVRVYEVRGEEYFAIVNWSSHQKVDHPRKSRIPAPPEDEAQAPDNTPETRVSRNSRETLAKESEGARETLAPDLGPRTMDHGPRTSRARAREGSTNEHELFAGYRRRWESRFPDCVPDGHSWAPQNSPDADEWRQLLVKVREQAALSSRAESAVADAVLDGLFADEWAEKRQFPPKLLVSKFAKYAATVTSGGDLEKLRAERAELKRQRDLAWGNGDHARVQELERQIEALSARIRQMKARAA